jgi:hypothetical protein
MPSSGMLHLVVLVRTRVFFLRVLRFLVIANAVSSSAILVNLMMEAKRSSETSVLTRATCNIPEDGFFIWDIVLGIYCYYTTSKMCETAVNALSLQGSGLQWFVSPESPYTSLLSLALQPFRRSFAAFGCPASVHNRWGCLHEGSFRLSASICMHKNANTNTNTNASNGIRNRGFSAPAANDCSCLSSCLVALTLEWSSSRNHCNTSCYRFLQQRNLNTRRPCLKTYKLILLGQSTQTPSSSVILPL